MKPRPIVLALCTIFFTGCCKGCTCEPPPPPPSPPITFGCRASVPTWGGYGKGKNDQLSSHMSSTSSAAREVALRWYVEANPGTKPDANCWSCTQKNLGPKERAVCDMTYEGILAESP